MYFSSENIGLVLLKVQLFVRIETMANETYETFNETQ